MMTPIQCVSAGCYWTTTPGSEVEQAAADLIVHWRAKHEPRHGQPIETASDLVPIDGTFTSHEQKARPAKSARSTVSVVRRNYLASDEPEMDDRGLTSGGTPPEEFWSRPDPDKAAMKRTRKLPMGRPLR
jgi:hypothetical protein